MDVGGYIKLFYTVRQSAAYELMTINDAADIFKNTGIKIEHKFTMPRTLWEHKVTVRWVHMNWMLWESDWHVSAMAGCHICDETTNE